MDSLYLLIPIALVFCVIAIKLLLWAIDSGQYDDLEGPAHRILMDDDDPMIPQNARPKKSDPTGPKEPGDRQDGGG